MGWSSDDQKNLPGYRNPERWDWDERDEAIAITATGGRYVEPWSVGNRKSEMSDGDVVYLLKQGPEPRGIVASGIVRSEVRQEEHWDDSPGREANYVDVDWERVVDDGEILRTQVLMAKISTMSWIPQGGGVNLHPPADKQVVALWDPLIEMTATSAPSTRAERRLAREAGYIADAAVRKAIETRAVSVATVHYEGLGYKVEDVGLLRSYDTCT